MDAGLMCGRLTNRLVISPTSKSSTRVAQGMIHEMELWVPLLHTTPKKVWMAGGPCQRMQPLHRRVYPLRRSHLDRRAQNQLRRITCVYYAQTGRRTFDAEALRT